MWGHSTPGKTSSALNQCKALLCMFEPYQCPPYLSAPCLLFCNSATLLTSAGLVIWCNPGSFCVGVETGWVYWKRFLRSLSPTLNHGPKWYAYSTLKSLQGQWLNKEWRGSFNHLFAVLVFIETFVSIHLFTELKFLLSYNFFLNWLAIPSQIWQGHKVSFKKLVHFMIYKQNFKVSIR